MFMYRISPSRPRPRPPGWHSLIQSVTDMDDYCTNQSDYDTPTQEESESTSGKARSDSVLLYNSKVIKERLNL